MKRNANVEMIRRVTISLCVFVVSFSAFAQERGDVAFGVNGLGGIYTDKILSYGIGFKLLYNVADPVRLAAEYAITNNLSSSVELRFKHDGRNHYIYLASIAYKF